MDENNNAIIEIKVAKKKNSKISKTEQKEKNAFHKKYNNIFVHLNRLKRWRYQKKSKYYKTPTDLPQDIIMIIKNKYSTIKDIDNLYSTLIKSRCFSVIKNRFEELGVKDWAYESDPGNPLNSISRFGDEENYVNYIFSKF
jgi:hypothetical protein